MLETRHTLRNCNCHGFNMHCPQGSVVWPTSGIMANRCTGFGFWGDRANDSPFKVDFFHSFFPLILLKEGNLRISRVCSQGKRQIMIFKTTTTVEVKGRYKWFVDGLLAWERVSLRWNKTESSSRPVLFTYFVFLFSQRTVCPRVMPSHCASCYKRPGPNDTLRRCTQCWGIGYCNQ